MLVLLGMRPTIIWVMSYKYRLDPTSEQMVACREHCAQTRFMWNLALSQHETAREMGQFCDWDLWDKQLAELRNSEGFEWLKAGSSSVQQQALSRLRQAFKNWSLRPDHFGYPKFKKKRWHEDGGFTIRDVRVRKLNRKHSAVHVPKVGWVKFRCHQTLGEHGMAHVTVDRAGRWFVSFSAEQRPVTKVCEQRSSLGVDRNVKDDTIATSDREKYSIPKMSPKEKEHLNNLKRKKANQQPGSRRWLQTKESIAKIYVKDADRRKNWVEQQSTSQVRSYEVLTYEDLKVHQMMKSASGTKENPGKNVAAKRGLNREIAGSCWSMLATRVRQKAEATPGTLYQEVPAAYTSQKCCVCGYTHKHNRNGNRFKCLNPRCRHEDDAGFNAATNIHAAGLVARDPAKQALPCREHAEIFQAAA